jgi:deoxyribonuclease (pyrimidine dimer)
MVRINLIDPKKLADQHLIAEYNEILMLLGYVRKHPEVKNVPTSYRLGKGHLLFFKDKLNYLAKRHNLLKKEMRRRNFIPTKTINLALYDKSLHNNWKPMKKDIVVINERITQKILKKPNYYTYQGQHKSPAFFIDLLRI